MIRDAQELDAMQPVGELELSELCGELERSAADDGFFASQVRLLAAQLRAEPTCSDEGEGSGTVCTS